MMKECMTPCCNDDPADWHPLNGGQRRARLIAGGALLLLAFALPWKSAAWIALAIVIGWFGATHVLAAAMAYPGCPELGVAPSLLLGRWIKVGCTPWRWLDAKLGLAMQ